MKNKLLLLLFIIAILPSCSTSQKQSLPYFSNIGEAADGTIPSGCDYSIKVIPDDELIITVNSLVPAATAHYNLTLDNPSLREDMVFSSTPKLQTYLVDKQGCINFPVLGKLKVMGKTTNEIKAMLEEQIGKDVENPYVRVQLANFKVNVLGEVKQPGAYQVTTERFSVLDALATAGDLTEYGNRANVLIIREEDGVKRYHRLNLNDAAMLSTPYFYLQQNDVVYVEPNKIRQDNSKYNQNNAFKLSVISTIVSACSVIASLIIALSVK
ncbi:MAG: polysaccharide biosynthesis/export family protein [Muribaculaceae bacterium]